MPSLNARTGAGAIPDSERSTVWGSVTGALAQVSSNIRAATLDTLKRVETLFDRMPPRSAEALKDARFGDPVGLGDVRSSPVLRAGPEPQALDRIGGHPENRPGMPDSARLVSPGFIAAVAIVAAAAVVLARR